MNIEEKLLNTKPREESGSKTSRKYNFQKDLSLYLLIEHHTKKNDYIFLFDFHEDLIIADSPIEPSKFDFYQIKSKDTKGNWTINKLTKAEKDSLSIIGKLYLNKIIFQESTSSLNFISNSTFGFKKLKGGQDTINMVSIRACDLDENDLEECLKVIKVEHSIIEDPDFESITEFHVTKLSNEDSSTHCLGALCKLINDINPSNTVNPELAYNQVINEITRRTNSNVGDKSFRSINEIFTIKGISKSQFMSFLEKAGLYKSVEQEWIEVKSSLESYSISYIELMKFKNGWREMSGRLLKDPNSIPLQELINEIKDNIKNDLYESMGLVEITQAILRYMQVYLAITNFKSNTCR